MTLSFSKYSGLGNDFVFVDNLSHLFPIDPIFIRNLCHRHEGIGADGVVLVEQSESADCKMRIFNADGSEAEMCGNALRCLYLFLKELGFQREAFTIQVQNRHLQISKKGSLISCEMGAVSPIEWDIELSFNQMPLNGHFINTGVPHFVIPTKDLHKLPVLPLGRFVREHPRFQPDGTNVNFISLNKERIIEIRTYERGVELETQACGTGCAAAAIIGHFLYNLSFPIHVKTIQGKILTFDFEIKENKVQNLKMIGPASFVFKGEVVIPQTLLVSGL